jgi:hypothetical protein
MRFVQCLAAALMFCLISLAQRPSALFAQVPVPVPVPAPITGQPIPVLSPNELDGLVAPIALYPDPLISQILVAATYPLEVVEAYQWLQRNPALSGPALTQTVATQNWDPSIQALVMFPDVLKRLNEDVAWTTSLGNALLNQQADVMNAIQRMRLSAEQAGRLVSTPQQQVIRTYDAGQTIVEIVPANPEVIYVPVYDPVWVWGPAVYYPYAHWYYPPVRSGLFFSVGIPIRGFIGFGWTGWGGWGWHPAWTNRTVIVNNTFIRQYDFNASRISVGRVSVWSHDAFHRRGVIYPTQVLNQRFRGTSESAVRPARPPLAAEQAARTFTARVPPAPVAVPGRAPVQSFREGPRERFENRAPAAAAVRPAVPNLSNRSAFGVQGQRPVTPHVDHPNFNAAQRHEGSHSGEGHHRGRERER